LAELAAAAAAAAAALVIYRSLLDCCGVFRCSNTELVKASYAGDVFGGTHIGVLSGIKCS